MLLTTAQGSSEEIWDMFSILKAETGLLLLDKPSEMLGFLRYYGSYSDRIVSSVARSSVTLEDGRVLHLDYLNSVAAAHRHAGRNYQFIGLANGWGNNLSGPRKMQVLTYLSTRLRAN